MNLLTVAEVASLFGVQPNTVRQWGKNGKLPLVKTPTGRLRVRSEDVEALIRQQYEGRDDADRSRQDADS